MNNNLTKKCLVALPIIALFVVATYFITTKMLTDYGVIQTSQAENVSDSASAEQSVKSDSVSKKDDGIEIVNVSGATFSAKMMIVKDPSRVKVSTIYPWKDRGVPVDKLVKMDNAVGGINGGLYFQKGNSGGRPDGVAVKDGVIQYNSPYYLFHMIGLDKNNKLRIINLHKKSKEEIEKIIKDEGIRDALGFPDEEKEESNWFARIIVDNEDRKVDGLRCCINPRTVIGQRADGAILLLVTDGRGKNSHIGATVVDLIKVMRKYGAVTAANLDGGSSSCMYYKDEYIMPCTTFYYYKSSWNFPTAFVVK